MYSEPAAGTANPRRWDVPRLVYPQPARDVCIPYRRLAASVPRSRPPRGAGRRRPAAVPAAPAAPPLLLIERI